MEATHTWYNVSVNVLAGNGYYRPGLQSTLFQVETGRNLVFALDDLRKKFKIEKKYWILISVSPLFTGTVDQYYTPRWEDHKRHNDKVMKDNNHARIN